MAYDFDNARPLAAIVLIVGLCWLLSENRRRFPVLVVAGGLAVQIALVLLLFAVPHAQAALNAANGAVDGLMKATGQGTQFVFNYLGGGDQPYAPAADDAPAPFIFAFQVLPLIMVVSALSALLWHWGILKLIIRGFGYVFEKTMGLRGASATATAANIFMGMVESPIVIKAYLDKLSRSELFLMMTVGLATVAGSTMVVYAAVLAPTLPNAVGHVLAASIISAPAGIVLARVMIPETPGAAADDADYASLLKYDSGMDAINKGVQDGILVIVNITAMLIVFVAFVGIVNLLLPVALTPVAAILNPLLPTNLDIDPARATLQVIFGYAFAPFAWLLGVPWGEAQAAGALLGVKLFLTEFIAFIELGKVPVDVLSERSRMIMTYALCGFANVASVGIMVGGLTTLMPGRREEVLGLAWKALTPGFLATCMAAAVVAALPRGLF
ncbi:MAG: nucleoside transporter C-terminal domain-containing protein [Hyphomonadaceae bacterium]|nr:nucleoside transporter C-terminal domain-containing protein [Hyphomonadaceae bacterium]